MLDKKHTQSIVFTFFATITFLVSVISIAVVAYVFYNGIGMISWNFLTDIPRDGMKSGGIFPAIIGTLNTYSWE